MPCRTWWTSCARWPPPCTRPRGERRAPAGCGRPAGGGRLQAGARGGDSTKDGGAYFQCALSARSADLQARVPAARPRVAQGAGEGRPALASAGRAAGANGSPALSRPVWSPFGKTARSEHFSACESSRPAISNHDPKTPYSLTCGNAGEASGLACASHGHCSEWAFFPKLEGCRAVRWPSKQVRRRRARTPPLVAAAAARGGAAAVGACGGWAAWC